MSVTINGTTGIAGVDGSASTPALQGTDSNTGITFGTDTVNVVTGGTTRATVNSSGNVGIGTSSPTARLTVASGTNEGAVRVGDNATYYGAFARVQATDEVRLGAYGASQNMTFYTVATERMRIDSSGNLLINTTSATGAAKLVVAADTTTANPMTVNNTRSTAATDYSILFYRNGSIVGSVQTSLSATSYVTSSDYRLKENIAPMTGALAKVAQLKPVTYTWKLDGSDGQGFIAHELAEVVPDCVTGEKDAVDADGNPVYQGIDTSFLVATLTAALQEQQAMIQTLTARIEALEAA